MLNNKEKLLQNNQLERLNFRCRGVEIATDNSSSFLLELIMRAFSATKFWHELFSRMMSTM